jgi:ArsR family transcriptional regulator
MLEQTFKALADENRLRIINLLFHGEFCVCELEVFLGLSQSNLSRHLGKLKTSGIITAEKDGQWVHYMISEVFKSENVLLFEYLQKKMRKDQVFEKDIERMQNYKKSKLSCSVIRENKEQVLKIINQEESHAKGK